MPAPINEAHATTTAQAFTIRAPTMSIITNVIGFTTAANPSSFWKSLLLTYSKNLKIFFQDYRLIRI